jgi:hypothetical protein
VRFGVVRVSHTAAAIADRVAKLQALTDPKNPTAIIPLPHTLVIPRISSIVDSWESRVLDNF